MEEGVILFLASSLPLPHPMGPASDEEVSHKLLTDPEKPQKKQESCQYLFRLHTDLADT